LLPIRVRPKAQTFSPISDLDEEDAFRFEIRKPAPDEMPSNVVVLKGLTQLSLDDFLLEAREASVKMGTRPSRPLAVVVDAHELWVCFSSTTEGLFAFGYLGRLDDRYDTLCFAPFEAFRALFDTSHSTWTSESFHDIPVQMSVAANPAQLQSVRVSTSHSSTSTPFAPPSQPTPALNFVDLPPASRDYRAARRQSPDPPDVRSPTTHWSHHDHRHEPSGEQNRGSGLPVVFVSSDLSQAGQYLIVRVARSNPVCTLVLISFISSPSFVSDVYLTTDWFRTAASSWLWFG
jgi:hypothetical protein